VSGDWNPNDPDMPTTRYDLGEWTVDERAEVVATLAEAGIAHSWDGDELCVSQDDETRVDDLLDDLEARFDAADAEADEDSDEEVNDSITEYELDDFSEAERKELSDMLDTLDIGYRWDGAVLLVPAGTEAVVDSCLDAIDGDGVEFIDES
jgi:hypothetical protein